MRKRDIQLSKPQQGMFIRLNYLDREKHVYSYTTPGYESKMKYYVKTERARGERSYEEERYTTVETSARYIQCSPFIMLCLESIGMNLVISVSS